MPLVALAGLALYGLLAFGLRSLVHRRRTGSSGFRGVSGPPGSVEWWGGVLFGVALAAAVAAPLAELTGLVAPSARLATPPVYATGITLCLAGLGGTLWAQFAMGDSWRIGVDDAERTALVGRGPFRLVRNPIYTSMLAAMLGFALLTPNTVAAAALGVLVAALELQVRFVEEPYLVRGHGARYRAYAAQTGRFLPGIGRLAGGA
jgi:protein-S-isoprenylcysteine O-methyltransferase Ste14